MRVLPEVLRLSGDEVTLRDWHEDDASALRTVCGDPDVCRFTSVPWTFTPAAGRNWVRLQRERRSVGTGLTLAVTRAGERVPVGSVNLSGFSEDGCATLGYWIVPAARGQGLALAATRLLCAWGFTQLGLVRIELAILPENIASRRVAGRLGAEHEGLRRDSHEAEGRAWDMAIYSLVSPAP